LKTKKSKLTTEDRICQACDKVLKLLLAKNRAYGDSALNPIAIFSSGDASQLIRIRIDDKLSRIRNNPDAFGEDPILDLTGYLILLMAAMEKERNDC
jgi:hypothetical protein